MALVRRKVERSAGAISMSGRSTRPRARRSRVSTIRARATRIKDRIAAGARSNAPRYWRKIAWVKEWCGEKEYTKHPEQKSSPVKLEAGKRYYVEALQKEGGGGDHLTVKWTLPDGKEEDPIPGIRLSPPSK